MDARLPITQFTIVTLTFAFVSSIALAENKSQRAVITPLRDPQPQSKGDDAIAPRPLAVPQDAIPSQESAAPITEDESKPQDSIRDRWPDGSPKIARQVAQDAVGNYVNHGSWKYWSQQGKLLAQGQFHFGKKHGEWARVYQRGESPLFKTPAFLPFQAPFTSQATFKNNKLEGEWIFVDADQHIVCRWKFIDGIRDGVSTWYYPEGMTRRQITFVNGQLDGPYQEWGIDGKLSRDDLFIKGRQLESQLVVDETGKIQLARGQFLQPPHTIKVADDWWNARPAIYVSQGKGVRHGKWISWHSNGELKQQAEFDMGILHGKFVAWHANGEIAVDGSYVNGKQSGEWTWRHADGLKKSQGSYVAGKPSGTWSWWKSNGLLANRIDYQPASKEVEPSKIDAQEPAANIATRPTREPLKLQKIERVPLGKPPVFR